MDLRFENVERLEPIDLFGNKKETYLRNLQNALSQLAISLGSEGFIDSNIISYVNSLSNTAGLFRRGTGPEIRDNFGIYKSIKVDARAGFPLIDELILLSDYDKTKDARRDLLGSKDPIAIKSIDAIINWPAEEMESSKTAITECSDKIREINFIEKLKATNYVGLPVVGVKTRDIQLRNEDETAEHFQVFYSGWDVTKKFFIAYSMNLSDDKIKYLGGLGPDKPGQIYLKDKVWVPTDELDAAMKSSFALHPQHYFNSFNALKGLHTNSITYFAFEGFETANSSQNFTEIFNKFNDAGVLLATVVKVDESKDGRVSMDNSKSQLYVICSDNIKQEMIDYYKHNKITDFKIIPYNLDL